MNSVRYRFNSHTAIHKVNHNNKKNYQKVFFYSTLKEFKNVCNNEQKKKLQKRAADKKKETKSFATKYLHHINEEIKLVDLKLNNKIRINKNKYRYIFYK